MGKDLWSTKGYKADEILPVLILEMSASRWQPQWIWGTQVGQYWGYLWHHSVPQASIWAIYSWLHCITFKNLWILILAFIIILQALYMLLSLALFTSQAFSWPFLAWPGSYYAPLIPTSFLSILQKKSSMDSHSSRFANQIGSCHSNFFQPCPWHQDVSRPYRSSFSLHLITNSPPGHLPSSQKAPTGSMSHLSQQPMESIWACELSMRQWYRVLWTL